MRLIVFCLALAGCTRAGMPRCTSERGILLLNSTDCAGMDRIFNLCEEGLGKIGIAAKQPAIVQVYEAWDEMTGNADNISRDAKGDKVVIADRDWRVICHVMIHLSLPLTDAAKAHLDPPWTPAVWNVIEVAR